MVSEELVRAVMAERTREAEVMALVRQVETAGRSRRAGPAAWSWLARLAGCRKIDAGRTAGRTRPAQAGGDA